MEKATDAIVNARFGLRALSEEECDQLTWLLTMPREAAGNFVTTTYVKPTTYCLFQRTIADNRDKNLKVPISWLCAERRR